MLPARPTQTTRTTPSGLRHGGLATSAAGALLWLASGWGPMAAAQDASAPPAAGFGERIEVALVNVDVWVSDKQGNAVTGLDAAGFEVLHDGQPVAISHFAEVRAGRVVTASAAAAGGGPAAVQAPVEPGHVVVYFDQLRLHPTRMAPLLRGLEEMLDAGAVEPERVLILRQERGLAVAAPFGSSREQLRAALEGMSAGGAAGADLENETRLALQAIRDAWEQSGELTGAAADAIASIPDVANPTGQPNPAGGPRAVVGGVGTGGGSDACGAFVGLIEPVMASWTRVRSQRIAITLANLGNAASFLAGLPGVKTLLYLSDGLDTEPGAALASYATSLCPSAGGILVSDAMAEEITGRFLELTRHANANRVTLHAVQATGLRAPGATSAAAERGPRGGGLRASGAFEARKRAAERDGLSLLAHETGGRAVFNQNEFGPALASIGEDSRSYYSLAYEPPPGAAAARSHRIEVKLADRSRTARYRRGYLDKDPEQWLSERLEGALNLGITSNPLEVRLGAGTVESAGDGSLRLPLHVMVPVERLAFLPSDGQHVAEIALRVMARDLETNALAVRDKTYRVRGAPGATGWADLPLLLELAPGSHLTAVGVQDLGSREASFVSATLDVRQP